MESKIVTYVDMCDASGFKFEVALKRGAAMTDAQIVTMFKLKKKLNQNLTVITQENQLKVYDNPLDIIKDFCDYRITKYTDRYEYLLDKGNTDLNLIKDKIEFIGKVISGELDFKNKNKQQIKDELQLVTDNKETIEVLIRMPIYSLCQDEIDKLKKEGAALYEQIKKWKAIDVTEQFIKELEVI